MSVFRWIILSSFLMSASSFSAADVNVSSFIVREGGDITLTCGNVTDATCASVFWMFNRQELVSGGKISDKAKEKSDRLSVTENCSLVIKKVTAEDANYYVCKDFKSRHAQLYLFVVTLTEQPNGDDVTFHCSVATHRPCEHRVKWLYNGSAVPHDKDMRPPCSVTSELKQESKDRELFQCEVSDAAGNRKLFPFSPQTSGETTGDDAKTTTDVSTTSGRFNTTGETGEQNPEGTSWLLVGFVAFAGFAALLIIIVVVVVVVVRRRRTEGNKIEKCVNAARPDEDGVCYASLSYSKQAGRKAAKARGDDGGDDDGDSVTYSTVKVLSSSAAASDYQSDCYAAVNKPKKRERTLA